MIPIVLPENIAQALEAFVGSAIRYNLRTNVLDVLPETTNFDLSPIETHDVLEVFAGVDEEFNKIESHGIDLQLDGDNYMTGRYTLWVYFTETRESAAIFRDYHHVLINWARSIITFPNGEPVDVSEFYALIWHAFLVSRLNFVRERYNFHVNSMRIQYGI